MGHSFGGATALTAAHRRPDLASAIVCHEPAIDWIPDDARFDLFDGKLKSGDVRYDGGAGGYKLQGQKKVKNLHKKDMLFMFSQEWTEKNWGSQKQIQTMRDRGELGPKEGISDCKSVAGSRHQGFSDMAMMTPVWLGREVGITGSRSPVDVAEDIAQRTLLFVEQARRRVENTAK
eukprot:CAMPEP_0118722528 /NCGR_PEP_ID=MMETSP0800-20121206/31468_1 /TAXON_ID=210618 ORGANISM="Striatella unipunctata, Strain CCMP2910" /NCGR_SAMPLE_ID=MMETSP0800 /ASSEMBLY_ACC=CAM_ASM_000638 /LENGTH=175 /DNA_ID=CAMNT_0006630793 /DNA_START=318 /DNA_END=845 /DNA_ORIENTATION=-